MIKDLLKIIRRSDRMKARVKSVTRKVDGVATEWQEARLSGKEVDVRILGRQLVSYGFKYERPIRRRFWIFGPWCARLERNKQLPHE